MVKNVIDAMAKGGYLVVGPTEGIYTMLDSLTKLKPGSTSGLPDSVKRRG